MFIDFNDKYKVFYKFIINSLDTCELVIKL
jgi:hypothetical protein